jgi:hypothetical protein
MFSSFFLVFDKKIPNKGSSKTHVKVVNCSIANDFF